MCENSFDMYSQSHFVVSHAGQACKNSHMHLYFCQNVLIIAVYIMVNALCRVHVLMSFSERGKLTITNHRI